MSTIETKSAALECPIHGAYTGQVSSIRFGEHKVAMKSQCPRCEEETKEQRQKQAMAERKHLDIRRFKAMGIEEKFWSSDFENFDAYNEELRRHLETCRGFAKRPAGKLVMLGENGNGKTHLAVSVLKAVGGKIYNAFEIGLKIRQSYDYDSETKEWEVFNELCTVPLLVIDEVEKVKDSESKQHWFSYVVGKRYDRMLPLIFITNSHTTKDCTAPQKPCPKCLEYHLENDVLSRIIEDGILMKFTNTDYRLKIRAAGVEGNRRF